MKKVCKFLSLGLLMASIVGCSCKKAEPVVNSELTNSANVISGTKTKITLTTQDVYKYIRAEDQTSVNKTFLTYLMGEVLDISNSSAKQATYNLKVKEYFKKTYIDVTNYKVNGIFNEDLLADELETKMFVINRATTPSSGPTVELGLNYDYSDYIKRGLNYDLYLEMLKEEYIIDERPNLLNNSQTRIISIYESDDLEDMEAIVADLFDGKYADLAAVSETKKADEREEIGRQYCVNLGLEDGDYYEGTCSASTSSSTYDSALYKFTVCENGVRCSPADGLAYQIQLINDKEYVKEQVINKDSTDVLYEGALNQLLRSDIEEHLKTVIEGQDKFLVNGLYNSDSEFNEKDIILSTGSNGKHYLVTVRVVDSQTQNIEDVERALELILNKVSDTTVLLHYLENLTVTVEDPELQSYYNGLIGKN